MARIPLQTADSVTGKTAQIFVGLEKALGMVPNSFKAMANSPAVLQGYVGFSSAMNSAKLSPAIREEIALLVAEQNRCDYCLSAHSALSKLAGLNQNQIDAARNAESDDPRARAALAFAKAVLSTAGGVTDADVEAVRRAGFSDAELAEIVAAVAINVLTNLFNRTFQVDIDFPVVHSKG
ncbi:MAG TPA: peroxidase-related enzyme [Pirellulales bacterium]|nr:peroxidase-related enzyme [Pirellulales bacterium]